MKLAVELEFPDNQAATVLQWLQNLPDGLIAHFEGRKQTDLAAKPADAELSEAEQHRLLHEVFGSWKSEESGEEMVRRIYADRQDQPREVEV